MIKVDLIPSEMVNVTLKDINFLEYKEIDLLIEEVN